MAAQFGDLFFQAGVAEESRDGGAEAVAWRIFLSQGVAEDLAGFCFHASPVAFGATLKAGFELSFDIADEKLGHRKFLADSMIAIISIQHKESKVNYQRIGILK